MRKRNAFTLVELLAVIVILAIIMIIAIPAVLDTMTTAKKKSMVEYAQKVANKAEEVYLSRTMMEGGYNSNGANMLVIVYDINKDLGLSSTGDYIGTVSILIHGEQYWKETILLNDEYKLSYNDYKRKYTQGNEISVDSIVSNNINSLLKPYFPNSSYKDINMKEYSAYFYLNNTCRLYSTAAIDGATGNQIFCTASPNFTYEEECPINEHDDSENTNTDYIMKAFSGQNLSNC